MVPGLGLVTPLQKVPFQRSVRVWFAPGAENQATAQASHGDSTLVAVSTLNGTAAFCAGVPDQLTQLAAEAVTGIGRCGIRPA